MKIRSGFVSNSSSSSFIVSSEHFPTVRDLAIYMLRGQVREKRYYEEDEKYAEGLVDDEDCLEIKIEEIEDTLFIKRLKNLDENQSISFPSINEDTYIRKVGDQYFVSTCNNTDWELWEYNSYNLTDNTKNELINLMNSYAENSDDCDIINRILDDDNEFPPFGIDYYDLNAEVLGIQGWDLCPNAKIITHGYHQIYLWNTVKYGKTCLICNPVFKRKEKLKNINKNSEE